MTYVLLIALVANTWVCTLSGAGQKARCTNTETGEVVIEK
jgi:hypothetical protein